MNDILYAIGCSLGTYHFFLICNGQKTSLKPIYIGLVETYTTKERRISGTFFMGLGQQIVSQLGWMHPSAFPLWKPHSAACASSPNTSATSSYDRTRSAKS